MSTAIYIAQGTLNALERGERDVAGVAEDASLIASDAWAVMCATAGGEKALIESLGLKDNRDATN